MTRATLFKHFELLADQPDAVAWAQPPDIPQRRRSGLFIEMHQAMNQAPAHRHPVFRAATRHHVLATTSKLEPSTPLK